MVSKKRKPTSDKATAAETPPLGPPVEFFNADDDAWYSVQLVLLGETLIVKYTEFQDEIDLRFHAQELKNSAEISKFKQRFRKLSLQLEPSDCRMVNVGMRVCALTVHTDDDRRFYDAIVEAVKREEHIIVAEKEICPCTVILSWLQGPNAGVLTTGRIEDLCPIQSDEELDPRVACFLALAKWKHGVASPLSELNTKDMTCNGEIPILFQCKSWSASQKSQGQKQMGSALPSNEECFDLESNEDVDLGGGDQDRQNDDDHYLYALAKPLKDVISVNLKENDNMENKKPYREACYFIVVENLEQDVSPSNIVEFIKQQTGLEVEAFVFLSLSSETYTRGALVVHCVEDLERLREFVAKPRHMITSSKGRPWIVSSSSAIDSMRPSFWCLEPGLKGVERQQSARDGLKVVEVGSEEYSKAEKLRDLFLEFASHQQLLFKRLALEEQCISFDT